MRWRARQVRNAAIRYAASGTLAPVLPFAGHPTLDTCH